MSRRLSPKKLRELFKYDSRGFLVRKRVTARSTFVGQVVRGTIRDKKRPYRTVRILGRVYYIHRVIFAIVHGYYPKIIDHKNRKRSVNRIENLRAASHSTNGYNSKLRIDNRSGHRGIDFRRDVRLWRVRLRINSRDRNLGYFKKKKDAIAAQIAATKRFHGKFRREITRAD